MMRGMRITPILIAAALILAALIALGCGVKSAPMPPESARPEQILDLRALPERRGIQLSWSRPERNAGGKRMRDLAGFTVLRSDNQQSYQSIVEVPVTDQERFQVATKFSYLDATAQGDHSYRYEVVARTVDGYESLPSNEVELLYRHRPAEPRAQGRPTSTAASPAAPALPVPP